MEFDVKPPRIVHACLRLVLFNAVFMLAASTKAEVVVIVSAQSPISSLTAAQTSRIFLGKTNNFPNDGAAYPIDQATGSAIRDEFYTKIVHKSSSQLAAYWAKVIFTGDGHPPEMLGSELDVVKAVASNPNAIGYVDKSSVNSSVRVVLEQNAESQRK